MKIELKKFYLKLIVWLIFGIFENFIGYTFNENKVNFRGVKNIRSLNITSGRSSNRVVIFQLVFYLQWMQFSQHSEAIPFYHGHSNPIGRAVEIPHISIYMSSPLPPFPMHTGWAERNARSPFKWRNKKFNLTNHRRF